MLCNLCKISTKPLYYNPEGCGDEPLYVSTLNNVSNTYTTIGTLQYCPNCGNVQVNINKEIDEYL